MIHVFEINSDINLSWNAICRDHIPIAKSLIRHGLNNSHLHIEVSLGESSDQKRRIICIDCNSGSWSRQCKDVPEWNKDMSPHTNRMCIWRNKMHITAIRFRLCRIRPYLRKTHIQTVRDIVDVSTDRIQYRHVTASPSGFITGCYLVPIGITVCSADRTLGYLSGDKAKLTRSR